MIYSKWKDWVWALLGLHVGSLIASGAIYGFITFQKSAPFLQIFSDHSVAPYYLTIYGLTLVFCFTLCGVGLVLGDLFGHRDMRAQLISRGLLVIGILAALLPLGLITVWDLVLTGEEVGPLVHGMQFFGKWITFVTVLLYAGVMGLLFFLGKGHGSVPKKWAGLCLVLACIGIAVAFSVVWIVEAVRVFRIIYLLGSIGYAVWAIWLMGFAKSAERLP